MKKDVGIQTVKCRLCGDHYDKQRAACTRCGTPNEVWESPEYMRLVVEMEKPLYRTLEHWAKQRKLKPDEALVSLLEWALTRRDQTA